MRQRLTLILLTAFLLLPLAGSASAFTIQDDPLMYTAGSGNQLITGEIDFLSVTATNLEMTLQVDAPDTLAGLGVLVCEDAACANIREATATGTTPNGGVDVTSSFIVAGGAAFTFAEFNAKGGKGGGTGPDTSDPFHVDYDTDNLAVGDYLYFALLGKKNKQVGAAEARIVPEPALAMVLLLGGGLAAAHAVRRRQS